MTIIVWPHQFSGIVRVPASKSHTIRRLLIATMANGVSVIEHPLDCLDTRSCLSVCRALGAEITEEPYRWIVDGGMQSRSSKGINCNVGNSGTTLFLALAIAALGTEPVVFDGDAQIKRRSAGPLLDALSGLGVYVKSANGCVPVTVRGPWKGGRVSLPCPTSQYLSALLLAAPLAAAGVVTEIDVPLLNEKPYIEMTLSYLDSQGVPYKAEKDFSHFHLPGGFSWRPVNGPVPGDFSSAAFPAAAAVITGGEATLLGLDPGDTQGDKAFFTFLEKMGCTVQWEEVKLGQSAGEWHAAEERQLCVSRPGSLLAGEFDLNDTPDLLPALAAVACFAHGDTALTNVASARIKETDRIAAMSEELAKLGVKTTAHPDALIVHGQGQNPAEGGKEGGYKQGNQREGNIRLDGRGDHRVFMALASAALGFHSPAEIGGAESANVTYPGFLGLLGAGLV